MESEQIENIKVGTIGDSCRTTSISGRTTRYWCIKITLSGPDYSETDQVELARDRLGNWEVYIGPSFGSDK